jgi:predicted TIM-barrel fold metal-dependent hydrolase
MIRALFAALLVAAPLLASAQPWTGPIFDAHLHYNDEAVQRHDIAAVQALLVKNGVAAILANSRPNDGTRALHAAAAAPGWKGARVVPFIRPYRDRADHGTWFRNPDIHRMVVAEERRGFYRGIGEFHIFGRDAATEVVKEIVDFSVAKNLVLHAHCDEEALEILFSHNPRARIIWAHTGFGTPLARVEALLREHPGLMGELSYRSGVTEGGTLAPAWAEMFRKHATRFMVGSDTWSASRWESYSDLIAEYRGWLGQLPREVAERVAWRNGAELFGLE